MDTVVLVHGAWHGGWCWKRVCPLLRNAGYEVFTPTLTGLGERSHLVTPQVGLETHITDIVNVFEYEDLRDVVLVGHSYAGLIITGVADRIPERLKLLVYLDAVTPEDGQSGLDLARSPERREQLERQARKRGDGLIPIPDTTDQPFGITDEGDVTWVMEKLTPHPLKTTQDPLQIRTPHPLKVSRAFISCTFEPETTRREELTSQGWKYLELAACHDAMVTEPKALVAMLLAIARETE